MGLTTGGQPLPPVLYRITPLPYALIVSPRDKIEQEANISLLPGLSLEERVALEDSGGATTWINRRWWWRSAGWGFTRRWCRAPPT